MDSYENVLRHSPTEEKFYRHLMRCLIGDGRYSDVVENYHHCHHVLKTKLGITPSPATISIYKTASSDN
ncbi:MAG: bacterial transcriptional activator domain-containing protein [Candidatus Thiodiazotropha sp.]